jgi:hypothetical protein
MPREATSAALRLWLPGRAGPGRAAQRRKEEQLVFLYYKNIYN